MAQADGIVSNASGAAVRADLNNQLAAVFTNHSGATEPSTTYAYQWWADTTTGLLKIRNATNTAWVTVGTLADANLGLLSSTGGVLTGNLTLNAQSDLRLADADSSNWVGLQAPATVTSNLTFTVPAADGTADQTVVTDGSGTLSFATRGQIVLSTAVASTSGTSIDFTGIPSWAKRVTVMFNGVSTNGTSQVLIQIGSGSFTTTGYTSAASMVDGSNVSSFLTTSGFVVETGQIASITRHGAISLCTRGSNVWIANGIVNIGAYVNARVCHSAGDSGTLSGALDRIRITTAGGANTFDAGTINILYEG